MEKKLSEARKLAQELGLELRNKKVIKKSPPPTEPADNMSRAGSSSTTPPPAAGGGPAAKGRHAKMTLPKFWASAVDIWFIQCETVFRRWEVTDPQEQFDAVVCSLPNEATAGVVEILRSHHLYEDPYEALKQKLVKKHTLSQWKSFDQVERLALADKEPSTLMAEMAAFLAPALAKGPWFQWMFLKKLPCDLRAALSLQKYDDEEQLASAADKWWDANSKAVLAATAMVTRPRRSDSQSPQRGRKEDRRTDTTRGGDRRQREKTPARDNGLCWYHRVHGDKATNCREPCNWSGNGQAAPSRN